jgi:hypothetical protein
MKSRFVLGFGVCLFISALQSPFAAGAEAPPAPSPAADDPDARPLATQADLLILKRARELLDSPSKWNRADNRKCPQGASTFSLYCALEVATVEVGKNSNIAVRRCRRCASSSMRLQRPEIMITG